VVLLVDRSPSMSAVNWTPVTQGLVDAIDRAAFDGVELGLVSAPTGSVAGPACVFGLPVSCGSPLLPQVAIGPAGPQSSVGAGNRQAIRDWLLANFPDAAAGDAFPIYDAMSTAVAALNTWSGSGRRILIIVTDGGMSCAELSLRPGYADCNGCNDWELPDSLAALAANANGDPSTPIETLIIGVPGADSNGSTCSDPPYSMRLALSAIAFAGSPGHVSGTCTGQVFDQAGGDPTEPCHTDLTTGFSSTAVADAIAQAYATALSDVVFRDGFESGDVLDWSAAVP